MTARRPFLAAMATLLLASPLAAEGTAAPADGSAAPRAEPWLEPAGAGACRGDLRSRLDAVADLLLDGRPAEAAAAARELLAAGSLPRRDEARARQLLARAEALLPPPLPPAPPPPPFPEASFPVLQAKIGGGFSAGTAGSLRLAADGVSFLATASAEPLWALAWDDVATLSRDDGLWDARHPLVLRPRRGSPRYLALVDEHGVDLPPDRLLAAFAAARREAERRRTATEDPDAPPGKPPGKESSQ